MHKYCIFISLLLTWNLAIPQTLTKIGEPTQLTPRDAPFLMCPRWSPVASQIMATGANYSGIYLISFPKGELSQVTDEPAAGYGAVWSHDGKFIAARVANFENQHRFNQIVVFDISKSTRIPLSSFESNLPGTPLWSKDDHFLYLNATDKIRTYPVSSEQKSLDLNDYLFVKNDQIFTLSSDLAIATRNEEIGRILSLQPAPDCSRYAVETFAGAILITDARGRIITQIQTGIHPSWSPDGKHVSYSVTADDGHRLTASDIYVLTVDSHKIQRLTDTPEQIEINPTWSPDSHWIAYDEVKTGLILVQNIKIE